MLDVTANVILDGTPNVTLDVAHVMRENSENREDHVAVNKESSKSSKVFWFQNKNSIENAYWC